MRSCSEPQNPQNHRVDISDTLFAPHPIQSVQSFFRKVPPPVLQREFQRAQSIGAVSNSKFLVFWEVLGGVGVFLVKKNIKEPFVLGVFFNHTVFCGGDRNLHSFVFEPKKLG